MGMRRGRVLLVLGLWLTLAAGGAAAQDDVDESYRLGQGDVVRLNVLQQPELDAELTIRPDGTAVISRVGAVPLAGLTVPQAEDLIRQRLRLFDPGIGDVSLTVLEYNALRIYVLGAVAAPGSYTFTSRPSLWGAIRAAGGPTDEANLSAVRLIRKEGELAQTSTFDLSALVFGRGSMPDVQLETQDTIVVPGREGVMSVPADAGVQVFGSVATPGVVSLTEPTRLVTILMQAGTPLPDSDLDTVWWVHNEGQSRFRSTRVNVKLFLEDGSLAGNPLVYPGDTIRVPQRGTGWWRDALTITAATATVLLAVDRLTD